MPGDLCRTGENSTAVVSFPGGNEVRLTAETTVELRAWEVEPVGPGNWRSRAHLRAGGIGVELIVWKGQIIVHAQPLATRNSWLRVRTPEALVSAAQEESRFRLAHTREEGTYLEVTKGRVLLTLAGESRAIPAGLEQRIPPTPGNWEPEFKIQPVRVSGRWPKLVSLPPVRSRLAATLGREPYLVPWPGRGRMNLFRPQRLGLPAPTWWESRAEVMSLAPAGIPAEVWKRLSVVERTRLHQHWRELTPAERTTVARWGLEDWQEVLRLAQVVTCQRNLQRFWHAVQRYTYAHQGRLPPAENWKQALFPYLEPGPFWQCALEVEGEPIEYQFNRQLGGWKLSAIRNPQVTVLCYEGIEENTTSPPRLVAVHGGGVNVLFADGRVRWMRVPLYPNVRWEP